MDWNVIEDVHFLEFQINYRFLHGIIQHIILTESLFSRFNFLILIQIQIELLENMEKNVLKDVHFSHFEKNFKKFSNN